MLRKLLDFGRPAARALAGALLLAGLSGGGALGQGISDTAPVQSAPAVEPTAPAEQTVEAAPQSHDSSQWALALSVLSLIGVAYLIATRPKHWHRSSSSSGSVPTSTVPTAAPDMLSSGQFEEVKKMITRALAEQLKPAVAQQPTRGPQPAASNQPALPKPAANRPMTKTASPAPPPPAAPQAVAAQPEAPAAAAPEMPAGPAVAESNLAVPRRAYVSSAPVNGRFRRNALQGQPAHNSIYELTWDPARPDETTFQVNPDPASHPRHISSYADVLEPACEFNLPQGAASRIVTEAPGLLRRVDGDDWEIVCKARIHFA